MDVVRNTPRTDSLKLISQLSLLKHLHSTAFKIEDSLGDKSSGKTMFMRGVQGKVSRPCWSRDYFYLDGKLQNVRDYLEENCVSTVSDELIKLALDIFNRYDNRRRMGVELLVLAMLGTKKISRFEMPDKYYSYFFVIDMLVSCRHRFQKPEASFFWSKQSEAILTALLRQTTRNLTKLSLPLCNDMILKSVSVYATHLKELEIQLALDCSEEGLLAIAGKSLSPIDQGFHRTWDHALYLHKDMGSPKEWYIKDSLLFTPPPPIKRILPPPLCDIKLSKLHPTGFGCKKLTKIVLRGDYIFPPIAHRAKYIKREKGPVIEIGIYSLLLGLPELKELVTGSTALAVARLRNVLEPSAFRTMPPLPLTKLSVAWDEGHTREDLATIGRCCPDLTELTNVSSGCIDDVIDADVQLCSFINQFKKLKKISFTVPISCLNNFLVNCGDNLTILVLSTVVHSPNDLIITRKFAPNLERLEGRFVVENFDPSNYSHHHHDGVIKSPNGILREEEIARLPAWRKLKYVELTGQLNLRVLQIVVGNAKNIEILNVTSRPHESSNNGVALSDEWLSGLISVNPVPNIRELSLRMDSERFVEDGSFSKIGLNRFCNYAVDNCPKLERLVGEFTKIPDKELADLENKISKRLSGFRIKNAEPYREFQNSEDNDRFYGMNEGYWRYIRENAETSGAAMNDRLKIRRLWGYVYRPYNDE